MEIERVTEMKRTTETGSVTERCRGEGEEQRGTERNSEGDKERGREWTRGTERNSEGERGRDREGAGEKGMQRQRQT